MLVPFSSILGLALPLVAAAAIGPAHANDALRARSAHNLNPLRLERRVIRSSASVSSSAAPVQATGAPTLPELYQQMAALQAAIEAKKNGIDTPVVKAALPSASKSTSVVSAYNTTLSHATSLGKSNSTIPLVQSNSTLAISSNQTITTGNVTFPSGSNATVHISSTMRAASATARPTTTASASVTPVTANTTATSSAAISAPSSASNATIPVSSGDKAVFVHHMIGNTYPYTPEDWINDVKMAAAAGFDGFALNLGTDSWQIKQLGAAYDAAAAYGSAFKLFISFDFTVFPCGSSADASNVIDLAAKYATHPNQATYQGTSRPIVSTFSGSDCSFGQGDWNKGFKTIKDGVKAKMGKDMFFVPSVFADPSTFGKVDVMDGELNWNGGWPTGDAEITFDRDETYLSALGDKAMMASVSTGFFTHYSKSSWNKNWIFVGDDFLFARRWELLVQNRAKFNLVEALTWNDYGESTYLGPIKGAQPKSEAWVDGFDHQPLLEINKYYAEAYKTGTYPEIAEDKIFLSARPHHNQAVATGDDIGRPTGGQGGPGEGYLWAKNAFFAFVLAKEDGEVEMLSGENKETFPVKKGANFLKLALATGSGMSATLLRAGKEVVSVAPKDYVFAAQTKTYNWNSHVFSS